MTTVGAPTPAKPRLAVWKFASCDGCQLTLLDCEDELLAVAERVDIAYFLEASSATGEGPYDVSLVEGSITTAHDIERIREVRASSPPPSREATSKPATKPARTRNTLFTGPSVSRFRQPCLPDS